MFFPVSSKFRIVRACEQAECGEVHDSKTFTFGDPGVAGLLQQDMAHSSAVRVVGGSLVVREAATSATATEAKRWENWKGSIRQIRFVPRSWQERSRMTLATQSQAICLRRARTRWLQMFLTFVKFGLKSCELYGAATIIR